MQKSIAIVFLIVLAIWGGFMFYRHQKQKESDEIYVAVTYSQMTEAANKSASAGLSFMGIALKKFYDDNKKYPDKLSELYPDYMKDKSFIENVNWTYTPGKNDFTLSKTVDIQGRLETASINKNLRPTSSGDGVKVASQQKPQTTAEPSQGAGGSAQPKPTATAAVARYTPPPEKQFSPEELAELRKQLLEKMAADRLNKYALTGGDEGPGDESYAIAGEASEIRAEIAERYLVWKNKNGALGFGNVIYPDLDQNLIYRDGKWLSARQDGSRSGTPDKTDAAAAAPDASDLTRKHGQSYLAWKDKNGTVGFGNVSYPATQGEAVFFNGQWLAVKAETTGIAGPPDTQPAPRAPDKTPAGSDYLAQKHGQSYLTWKDKNGAIGFGNVIYPASPDHLVYVDGEWVPAESTAVDPPGQAPSRTLSLFSRKEAAQRLGNLFLTWKNKNGRLGFGNVVYPDREDIIIYSPDTRTWEETEGHQPSGGRHAE